MEAVKMASMDYTAIIKEVGRGKDGATDLDQDTARALYGDLLDGKVPDLEMGALLVAFRIKGESETEMLGFHEAMQARMAQLKAPKGKPMPVVISSYNGARRQANLTPLLALLLAREGLPVLVHGLLTDPKRVTTAQIFAELGIPACDSLEQAQQRLDAGEVVFVTPKVLSPGLDAQLEMRWRLGVRNSTHTLAKLADPFHGQSLKLVSVTHPDYINRMGSLFVAGKLRAMLSRGTEGEVYANPKRCPQLEFFAHGHRQVLAEAEEGSIGFVPVLPESMDPVVTARWIEQALAGEVPIPEPIMKQVQCCRIATGLTS
jgi:anthranilate phosphoribosyltransferase